MAINKNDNNKNKIDKSYVIKNNNRYYDHIFVFLTLP